MSNTPHSSRKFAQPVSTEDIAITMKSATYTKENTQRYQILLHLMGRLGFTLCKINRRSDTFTIAEELQRWLCAFILEVRKKDGNVFVPNTLHHICCGIIRYLQTNGMHEIDIFKDPGFSQFQMVLDAEMEHLQLAGIGTVHQKAEPITFEEEEILWQKGILGDHNP